MTVHPVIQWASFSHANAHHPTMPLPTRAQCLGCGWVFHVESAAFPLALLGAIGQSIGRAIEYAQVHG